jgi:hypothetical protein
MGFTLECDICGRMAGTFDSYDEWEAAARRLGWAIGEDEVICRQCLIRAEPPNGSK